jgi:hypothetical protein
MCNELYYRYAYIPVISVCDRAARTAGCRLTAYCDRPVCIRTLTGGRAGVTLAHDHAGDVLMRTRRRLREMQQRGNRTHRSGACVAGGDGVFIAAAWTETPGTLVMMRWQRRRRRKFPGLACHARATAGRRSCAARCAWCQLRSSFLGENSPHLLTLFRRRSTPPPRRGRTNLRPLCKAAASTPRKRGILPARRPDGRIQTCPR